MEKTHTRLTILSLSIKKTDSTLPVSVSSLLHFYLCIALKEGRENRVHGWMEVLVGEGAALDSHLIVVGWKLIEQLFDAVFLSWAVHIGHLVLRQGAVVLMNLRKRQRHRNE